MGTRRSLKSYAGFQLYENYPAIVAQYDENDIIFKMKDGIKAEAHISDLGVIGGIEIEELYNLGDKLTIKVVQIHRNGKIKAVPLNTPADEFIRRNPVGSYVNGTVVEVTEDGMLVKLSEDVYCFGKKRSGCNIGKVVLVKIHNFNHSTKKIYINRRSHKKYY